MSLRQSVAISEVGAFEHERGVVIIASKSALERFNKAIGMKDEEVLIHLTSLARDDVATTEMDHMFLIKGKLVTDISSQVPQATLDKISRRLKLQSRLSALVETGMLSKGVEVDENEVASLTPDEGSNHDVPNVGLKKGGKCSRVDPAMLEVDHNQFLEDAKPVNTKKSTKGAVSLFNGVMEELELSCLEASKVEELPKNLNTFFRVLRKPSKNNEEEQLGYYNASSLETYFQSLARAIKELFTVDIKSDVRFHQCRETLKVKKQESTANAEVAGKNAKKSIPAKSLALAYAKEKLGTNNPQALCATVVLAAMGPWGCRLKDEIYNIRNQDLEYGPKDDEGIPEYIKLSERLTKVERGQRRQPRELAKTLYADKEMPEQCQLRAVLELQKRKTKEQLEPSAPLFWTCRQLKGDAKSYQFWFTSIRMGVHKIGSLIPDQLRAAGVDIKGLAISGYSGRKTTLQGGLESGIPGPYLAKVVGQKAYSSTGSYIEHEDASAKAMSIAISRRAHGDDTNKFEDILAEVRKKDFLEISALKSGSSPDDELLQPVVKSKNPSGAQNVSYDGCPLDLQHSGPVVPPGVGPSPPQHGHLQQYQQFPQFQGHSDQFVPPVYYPPQYPPTPGQYPPTPGQYRPTPGQYPQTPGQYPPTPGQYAPTPGQYPPTPGHYPPTPGQYPPSPGQYPPTPGQHPPIPRHYPMSPAQYIPPFLTYPSGPVGLYPTPTPELYPPPAWHYPPQTFGQYPPPTFAQYPSPVRQYPPTVGQYPPPSAAGNYPPPPTSTNNPFSQKQICSWRTGEVWQYDESSSIDETALPKNRQSSLPSRRNAPPFFSSRRQSSSPNRREVSSPDTRRTPNSRSDVSTSPSKSNPPPSVSGSVLDQKTPNSPGPSPDHGKKRCSPSSDRLQSPKNVNLSNSPRYYPVLVSKKNTSPMSKSRKGEHSGGHSLHLTRKRSRPSSSSKEGSPSSSHMKVGAMVGNEPPPKSSKSSGANERLKAEEDKENQVNEVFKMSTSRHPLAEVNYAR